MRRPGRAERGVRGALVVLLLLTAACGAGALAAQGTHNGPARIMLLTVGAMLASVALVTLCWFRQAARAVDVEDADRVHQRYERTIRALARREDAHAAARNAIFAPPRGGSRSSSSSTPSPPPGEPPPAFV